MLAVDWITRVVALVAIGVAFASFGLSYAQHRRDKARRADEELTRDSADLTWWLEHREPAATVRGLAPRMGPPLGVFVQNNGADAHKLEVRLERSTMPTLSFALPLLPRGGPVRCGDLDLAQPMGLIEWSVIATWYDRRNGKQIGIWPIRHFGKA